MLKFCAGNYHKFRQFGKKQGVGRGRKRKETSVYVFNENLSEYEKPKIYTQKKNSTQKLRHGKDCKKKLNQKS